MDIAASNATVSADEIASGDVQTLDPELNVDPTTGPADLTKAEQTALEASCGINFDLDPRETKEVERYFTYFTHKARKLSHVGSSAVNHTCHTFVKFSPSAVSRRILCYCHLQKVATIHAFTPMRVLVECGSLCLLQAVDTV